MRFHIPKLRFFHIRKRKLQKTLTVSFPPMPGHCFLSISRISIIFCCKFAMPSAAHYDMLRSAGFPPSPTLCECPAYLYSRFNGLHRFPPALRIIQRHPPSGINGKTLCSGCPCGSPACLPVGRARRQGRIHMVLTGIIRFLYTFVKIGFGCRLSGVIPPQPAPEYPRTGSTGKHLPGESLPSAYVPAVPGADHSNGSGYR